jgi:hypothetical protein
MKLTGLKRTLLAGLVTLSVVGAPLATFTAGHASADPLSDYNSCYRGVTSGTGCSRN